MKRKFITLTLSLCCFSAVGSFTACSNYDKRYENYNNVVKKDGFAYQLVNNEWESESYYLLLGSLSTPKGSVEIPSSVDDIPVRAIATYAFSKSEKLESVTIPDSVEEIQGLAFEYCLNLVSVKLPDNEKLEIANDAFIGSNQLFQTVDNVKYVDDWAIGYDGSITAFALRENTVGIANGAFQSCNGLKDVEIPSGVKTIGNGAFSACDNLENVTIGSDVQRIGSNAFSDCTKLKTVEFKVAAGWYEGSRDTMKDLSKPLANAEEMKKGTSVLERR